jgi:hypothetical protein
VEANFATRQSSFFVDDLFLGSFDFDPIIISNILDRGSMVTYAAPDTDFNHKSGYSAHFDQFEIEVVPLPPSLLLLASGFLGLAGWRRIRKG